MSSGRDVSLSINTAAHLDEASSSRSTSPGIEGFKTTVEDASHHVLKWASLLVLIFFTTVTSVVSQRSRATDLGESYSIATSVLLSELFKFGVGFALAVFARQAAPRTDAASLPLFSEKDRQQDDEQSEHDSFDSSPTPPSRTSSPASWPDSARHAWNAIFCPSAWLLGLPALLYVCQNMLQLTANSYLSSVDYQGLSQLKLVTAAMISVFMFGKRLSARQWMCLPVLLLGVLILTQESSKPSAQDIADAAVLLREPGSDSPFSHRDDQDGASAASKLSRKAAELAWHYSSGQLAIGSVCVMLACFCGSFSGVYIESRLKSSMSVALSVRNAQLASFSILTAATAVVLEAISHGEWVPLANFSTLAWITVILKGATGYVVSATLRYADTIMKGFATSVAIITTIALESTLTARWPTLPQLLGSSLILFSTYDYVRQGSAR